MFENINGRLAALSKIVIDCTGDGNVAANAGCAFELGEKGDYKECQAMTLMFLVGNIPDKYILVHNLFTHSRTARKHGKLID